MSNSAPKYKIGFVLDDSLDKADGVQQYVLALGAWLAAQGHDVHYLVSTTRRRDLKNVHSLSRNMAVRFNGNRMSMPLPASARAIRQLLAREQFDVLHVQMPYSPLLAQKIIRLADPRTAIVGTFHIVPHGRHVAAASRLLALWNARSLKRFDKILSVSTAAQEFARRTFGVESEVLPNVVDYNRFAKAPATYKRRNSLQIVFLGRLVPRKGCRTLLEAVHLLRARGLGIPFDVIICGRGPLEAKLKVYVHDAGLDDQVHFTGFVSEEEKPRHLASADIAVFPSTGGESFGIVLIEAMAAGAAVLAGDNSGYRSVLHEKPELLFPATDAAALADKLAWLLEETTSRDELKVWGLKYARRFDTATVGKQLLHTYEEALEK